MSIRGGMELNAILNPESDTPSPPQSPTTLALDEGEKQWPQECYLHYNYLGPGRRCAYLSYYARQHDEHVAAMHFPWQLHCTYCGLDLVNKNQLVTHIIAKHPEQTGGPTQPSSARSHGSDTTFTCPYNARPLAHQQGDDCGPFGRVYLTKRAYLRHTLECHEYATCPHCQTCFHGTRALQRHISADHLDVVNAEDTHQSQDGTPLQTPTKQHDGVASVSGDETSDGLVNSSNCAILSSSPSTPICPRSPMQTSDELLGKVDSSTKSSSGNKASDSSESPPLDPSDLQVILGGNQDNHLSEQFTPPQTFASPPLSLWCNLINPFSNKPCRVSFERQKEQDDHASVLHNWQSRECPWCSGNVFDTHDGLLSHANAWHKEIPGVVGYNPWEHVPEEDFENFDEGTSWSGAGLGGGCLQGGLPDFDEASPVWDVAGLCKTSGADQQQSSGTETEMRYEIQTFNTTVTALPGQPGERIRATESKHHANVQSLHAMPAEIDPPTTAGNVNPGTLEEQHESRHLPPHDRLPRTAPPAIHEWIIDSGATVHICCQLSLFTSTRKLLRPVAFNAVGEGFRATHVGTVILHLSDNSNLELQDVYWVPRMRCNLFSTVQFVRGGELLFIQGENKCWFLEKRTGWTGYSGTRWGDLTYRLDLAAPAGQERCEQCRCVKRTRIEAEDDQAGLESVPTAFSVQFAPARGPWETVPCMSSRPIVEIPSSHMTL